MLDFAAVKDDTKKDETNQFRYQRFSTDYGAWQTQVFHYLNSFSIDYNL